MKRQFTLYSNSYCHLCSEMHAAIMDYSEQYEFGLEVIDIEGEAELEEKYGEKIPVLEYLGNEVCHYYLDNDAFQACFR